MTGSTGTIAEDAYQLFRNRPAFDDLIASHAPPGEVARAVREYRLSVDEHFLAADAAMSEMKRLEEELVRFAFAPQRSEGPLFAIHWRDKEAAEAISVLYQRSFRYALNEVRATLDSATYEVVTSIVGPVEGVVEVGFSDGYINRVMKKYPDARSKLMPILNLIHNVRQRSEFKRFDGLRQISTHRRIPYTFMQGVAYYVDEEPLDPPYVTHWLPNDDTSRRPQAPAWSALELVKTATRSAAQTIDDLYGVVVSAYGADESIRYRLCDATSVANGK